MMTYNSEARVVSVLLQHAVSLNSYLNPRFTLRQYFPFQHLIIDLRICSLFQLFIFREQLWLSAAPRRLGLWEFCWALSHQGRHNFCYLSLWGATAHRLKGRGWMQPCRDVQLITKHLCYYSPFIILLFSFLSSLLYCVFTIFPASYHMHYVIIWTLTITCKILIMWPCDQ